LLMTFQILQASNGARHQARSPLTTGSTRSALGDPVGNARRPHPARPAARSQATVTMPGPSPPQHEARPAGPAVFTGIQNSGSLRCEWETGIARQVRFMPPGSGHDRHRTIPDAAR